MYRSALFAVSVLAAGLSAEEPAGAANRDAMKKLAFLTGKWAGEATLVLGPDKTETVKQREDVQLKLGGAVLLIEGIGTGRLPDSEKEGVVFNAMAVINYDAEAGKYRMKAYRAEGTAIEPEFALTETGFTWQFTLPGKKTQIKYTATVADGSWNEVGEMSLDGVRWNKFFGMIVKRVKE
jgi:hypothetical protein